MTKAGELSKTDMAGAYAVAAEAQERETSPQNYAAALLAGVYANRMGNGGLARSHLEFALQDIGSNPKSLRAQAWHALAITEVDSAFREWSTHMSDHSAGRRDLDAEGFRRHMGRIAGALTAAEEDMQRAISLARECGESDDARRYQLITLGYRRMRDNMEAANDLLKCAGEASWVPGSSSGPTIDAVVRRLDAMLSAWNDLCADCADSETGSETARSAR